MRPLAQYQDNLKRIDVDLTAVYKRYAAEAYAAGASVAAALLIAYLVFVPRVLPRLTVVPFPVWFAYSMRRFRSAAHRGRELRGRRGFYERGVALPLAPRRRPDEQCPGSVAKLWYQALMLLSLKTPARAGCSAHRT